MKNRGVKFLAQSAVIAALYVIFGYLVYPVPPFQVRLGEALTILPCFTPAAVPGLFVGCVISNILTGCNLIDVICGSAATLLGALGTYLLRRYKWLAPIPAIIANTLILPPIFAFVYGEGSLIYFIVTVGLGELISCGIFGTALTLLLGKYEKYLKL